MHNQSLKTIMPCPRLDTVFLGLLRLPGRHVRLRFKVQFRDLLRVLPPIKTRGENPSGEPMLSRQGNPIHFPHEPQRQFSKSFSRQTRRISIRTLEPQMGVFRPIRDIHIHRLKNFQQGQSAPNGIAHPLNFRTRFDALKGCSFSLIGRACNAGRSICPLPGCKHLKGQVAGFTSAISDTKPRCSSFGVIGAISGRASRTVASLESPSPMALSSERHPRVESARTPHPLQKRTPTNRLESDSAQPKRRFSQDFHI